MNEKGGNVDGDDYNDSNAAVADDDDEKHKNKA